MSEIGDDVRQAARRALEAMGESSEGREGKITRVVLDVVVDGRTEMVTLGLRDGDLFVQSTDGEKKGPHVLEALRLIAAGADALPKGVRTSPGEIEARMSLAPPDGRTSDPDAAARRAALADAIQDVVTAVARVGVREARDAPTVREALERLTAHVPPPMPVAMARSLGVLRASFTTLDTDRVARILEGLARLTEDLRADAPDERARRRMVSWLGATAASGSDVTRISDRTFVEVGREYLAGLERASVERRYLVCTDTGEIFREERTRGAAGASVGPCPRVVTVGLGEVEEGASPRAIRLLQYAVSSTAAADVAERVSHVASRKMEDLARSYRETLERFPGIAEPFAVVAPGAFDRDPGPVLLDAEGVALPLARADEPARAEALVSFLGEGVSLEWIAGRLVDVDGCLLMMPCSAAIRTEAGAVVRRLS
jgi:hypothetical protein